MSYGFQKVAFALSVLFCVSSVKAAPNLGGVSELDMSEPPFWMSSYEEFSDLRAEQKQFYLEKLLPLTRQLPGLDKTTKEQLKDATEWYQTWNSLRKKIYEACLEKSAASTCEELADARVDAINLFSNQKQENRRMDREAVKEKQKKRK